METTRQKSTRHWLPYALGALLVALFVGLGFWQIGRAQEKRAAQDAFERQTNYTRFVQGMDVQPYQQLAAEGVFDAERQFLLDNIVVDSRNGHYVVTPLVYSDDEPVLLVNRGWLPQSGATVDPATLAVPDERTTVRGRVGTLPRAGYRMGAAIEAPSTWPQHAVFPTLDDVAASLGREVQPFVLLLAPGEEHGFLRRWAPAKIGPGRHHAYAFQWFAMAAVLAILLAWNYWQRGYGK